MSSGGGGGGSRTTTVQQPPQISPVQEPYLRALWSTGTGQYREGPLEYFPGETVAGQSPYSTQAIEQLGQLGQAGMPRSIGVAQAGLENTLRGRDESTLNPYLDQLYGHAAGQVREQFQTAVLPELETRFARAGRTGDPAYQGALSRAGGQLGETLSGLASRIYAPGYEAERQRQEARYSQALQMTPGYAQLPGQIGAEQAGYLQRAGMGQEAQEQEEINAAIDRWNFEQMEPWQRIGMWQETLGLPVAGAGGSSQVTRIQRPSFDWGRAIAGLFGMQG
jgi:hypothetical protein